MSKEIYPFIKCLNPKKIINPYNKESLVVPCGKCEACAIQKSSMNTLKCKLESKFSKFVEFVTLTYSDAFVPRCKIMPVKKLDIKDYVINFGDPLPVVQGENMVHCLDNILFQLVDVTDRFGTHGIVLHESFMKDLDLFSLRKKVGYGDYINVLRYEDIQLFLKRLRFKLYKLYGVKIRYYCVGEYGPKHYRPHWHLLLFYEDDSLAEGISKIISSCWPYGRVDSSKSRGKCASYCASYVNSSCQLPPIYRGAKTKPKCYHSIRLGEAFCKDSIEEVYQQVPDGFTSRGIILDNVYTEFHMWRSLTARYFPRCKSYSVRSIEERVEAYRIKGKLSKWLCEESVSNCAKFLVDFFIHYSVHNSSPIPLVCYDDDINDVIKYFAISNNLNLETIFGSAVDKDKLYSSIYRELWISDYFLTRISKTYDYSICKDKVLYIDKFYKDEELKLLNNQLEYQSQHIGLDLSFNQYKYVYTNLSDDFDIDSIFIFRKFKEKTKKTFNDSLKIKILNDENNVLL